MLFKTIIRFNKNSHPPIVTQSKVFDEYRQLKQKLESMNVGANMMYNLEATFPMTIAASALGMRLNEDQIRER
jgi:hypothetical protein